MSLPLWVAPNSRARLSRGGGGTGGGGTTSGNLPSRMVQGYLELYQSHTRLNAVHNNYNVIMLSFAVGVGSSDPGAVTWWPGFSNGDYVNKLSTLAGDCDEKLAQGKKVILSIGGWSDLGGSSYGYQFKTTQHVDRFMATVTPLIDAGRLHGIDWDLEHPENLSAAALIDATQRLKSLYGNSFIVGAAPFDGPLFAIYEEWAIAVRHLVDVVSIQFYTTNTAWDTVSNVITELERWNAVTGLGYDQLAIGCATVDAGRTLTAYQCRDRWDAYVASHPTARGMMHWAIGGSREIAEPNSFPTVVGNAVLATSPDGGGGSAETVLWQANLTDGIATFKYEVSTYLSNASTPTAAYSTDTSGRVLNVAWPSGNDGHGAKFRSRFKSCAGAADGGANHLGIGDKSDLYLKFDLRYPANADLDTTTSKIAGLGGVPDDKTGWQTRDSPTGISNSWNARVCGYPTSWHRSDKSGPGLVGYLYARTANGGVTQQESTNGWGIEIVFASNLNGTGTQYKIPRDTWMPITMRVKMNTPGVEDGLYEAWVGNTKWVSVTAQWLAAGETTQINQLLMDSFFNTSVAGGTSVQYQNYRLTSNF